jgi:hypothetical protein
VIGSGRGFDPVRDHDMPGFQQTIADADGAPPIKQSAAAVSSF